MTCRATFWESFALTFDRFFMLKRIPKSTIFINNKKKKQILTQQTLFEKEVFFKAAAWFKWTIFTYTSIKMKWIKIHVPEPSKSHFTKKPTNRLAWNLNVYFASFYLHTISILAQFIIAVLVFSLLVAIEKSITVRRSPILKNA